MNDEKILKEKLGSARKRKKELKSERAGILNELEKMLNAKDPKYAAIEQKEAKVNDLRDQILSANAEIEAATDEVFEAGFNPDWQKSDDHSNFLPGDHSTPNGEDVENWQSVSDDSKGQKIKVLGPRASLKQEKGLSDQRHDMAEYLRDRVRGYTANNSFQNQMSTTSDSALVPEPLAAGIIDKARNKSRVIQAGARTFEMTSKTETIAQVSEDASVEWKEENDSHTSSNISFLPLEFSAKTLIGSVKSSVELAEDSGNLATLVEDNLAAQIALELDRAALLGSGTGAEPRGIFDTPNVQVKDLGSGNGGPITDYSEFSRAHEAILAENGMPNGIIYAPRTWGTLDRLTATDGQPLMAPQSYKDLPKYQTQQVPTDLTLGTAENASLAFVADWRQVMIGIRTKVRLEVTRFGSSSDASAFENLQIWFRAYARYDIQLAHPKHFYVINGITPEA